MGKYLTENDTINFGKHKGKTVGEIFKDNAGWLLWYDRNCTNRTPISPIIIRLAEIDSEINMAVDYERDEY